MDYSIVWVRGHVEVYDWAGRFCFSADNVREAREELALTAEIQLGGALQGRPLFLLAAPVFSVQESIKLRIRSFTPNRSAMSRQFWISSCVLSLSTIVSTTWGT